MPRDYARQSSSRARPAKRRERSAVSAQPRSAGRASPVSRRPVWSAPSFSAGVLFGAALVLVAIYAGSAFEDTVIAVREPVTEPDQIDFEFEQILTEGTVEVDPDAYQADFPEEDPNAPPPEYEIQAISVRSSETAAALAAELKGMGLRSRFERADLSTGTWYRVMVGPFTSRVEANRAMTELRKRKMTPRMSKIG